MTQHTTYGQIGFRWGVVVITIFLVVATLSIAPQPSVAQNTPVSQCDSSQVPQQLAQVPPQATDRYLSGNMSQRTINQTTVPPLPPAAQNNASAWANPSSCNVLPSQALGNLKYTEIGSQGAPEIPRDGVNWTTFHALWSGDNEPDAMSNADYIPNPKSDPITHLRTSSDLTFQSPPSIPSEWNMKHAEEFPTEYDDTNQFRHPTNIEDGSVQGSTLNIHGIDVLNLDSSGALYSITPSTYLHKSQGDVRHYAPSNGTVIATTDYMTEDLVQWDRWYSNGDRRWKFYDKNVTMSMTPDTGFGGATDMNLDIRNGAIYGNYTDLPTFTTQTGELGVQVEYKAVVTYKEQVESCDSDGNCQWVTVELADYDISNNHDQINDVVHTYAPKPTTELHYSRDGESYTQVKSNTPWHGIQLDYNSSKGDASGSDTVVGQWRYYTQRDKTWDEFEYKDKDGFGKKYYSPVRPLEVHAYPSRYDPKSINGSGKAEVVATSFNTSNPLSPPIPNDINIDTVPTQYNETEQLSITHPLADFTPSPNASNPDHRDASKMLGVVYGTEYRLDQLLFNPENGLTSDQNNYHFDTLTDMQVITSENNNGDGYNVSVYLQELGLNQNYPLTVGTVIIGGSEYNIEYLNASGTEYGVVEDVTIPHQQQVSVVWEPPHPTTNPTTYATMTKTATPPTNLSFSWIVNDIFPIAYLLFILFVPLWFFDRMFGLGWLWPPWQDFL